MIFGEIASDEQYESFYPDLLIFILQHFDSVKYGTNGDVYIRISENNEVVELDTVTAMRFQIKECMGRGVLVAKVIRLLKSEYGVYLYDEPQVEEFEDDFDNSH